MMFRTAFTSPMTSVNTRIYFFMPNKPMHYKKELLQSVSHMTVSEYLL